MKQREGKMNEKMPMEEIKKFRDRSSCYSEIFQICNIALALHKEVKKYQNEGLEDLRKHNALITEYDLCRAENEELKTENKWLKSDKAK